MKRILSLLIILTLITNLFSFTQCKYAFAEETESESFMNKKVPVIKYRTSKIYRNIYERSLYKNGYKYIIPNNVLIISIGGSSSIAATLGFSLWGLSMGMFPYNNDAFLLTGATTGGILIFTSYFINRRSPNRYIELIKENKKSSRFTGKLYYILNLAAHSFLSAMTVGYINLFISKYTANDEYISSVFFSSNHFREGFVYGFYGGIALGILSTKNLNKIFGNNEGKIELYPNIMFVDENKPVMTINMAYRF